MKSKASNKLNILLIAITLLLLFVACVSAIDTTHSWLEDDEEIGFHINVKAISIEIKQGERIIDDTGYISLDPTGSGVKYLEANKTYTLNVTITNKEEGVGYYIRCQAFAVVNGVTYNINNCITGDFYDHPEDGQAWLYSVNAEKENTAMTQMQTLTLIESVKFPQSFIDSVQGQYVKLHLFIEGSATDTFD